VLLTVEEEDSDSPLRVLAFTELSKPGIPNSPLTEGFSDDGVLVGSKDGTKLGFIQVKAYHPDRSGSFLLKHTEEKWCSAKAHEFCVLVCLGATATSDPPRYWIASKREVGEACLRHGAHGRPNFERRFFPKDLPQEWESRCSLFDEFRPAVADAPAPAIVA
jgi:hypothetical protein